jgi:thiol-disulfide isomerase/thioredoxin
MNKIQSSKFKVRNGKCMKRILTIICGLLWVGGMHAQEVRAVKVTELEKIISETDRPLVINMWATWCVPCIEEIPYYLEEIKKHNKGVSAGTDSIRLILVSLDGKENSPQKYFGWMKPMPIISVRRLTPNGRE